MCGFYVVCDLLCVSFVRRVCFALQFARFYVRLGCDYFAISVLGWVALNYRF